MTTVFEMTTDLLNHLNVLARGGIAGTAASPRRPAPCWLLSRLCLCLCLCLYILSPLLQAAPTGGLRFEQLGAERGLPHPSISAIFQDRGGFLWFAGQGGLSRYDGYRFVTYRHDPADPRSLSDDSVQSLIEDRAGQLWVGTRNGLQRYERRREDFTRFLAQAPGVHPGDYLDVRAIVADRAGLLWLATRTGLVRFDPVRNSVSVLRHDAADPSSLASDEVYALAFDAAGGLWLGTGAGVDYLAPGARRFSHFPVAAAGADAPQRNHVRALAVDGDGTLWVGTARGLEAWRLDGGAPQARQRFGRLEGIGQGLVTAFYRDRDGGLWVGTQAEGLKRWDRARRCFDGFAHQAGNPATVADDHVSSVFQDRSGILWVGTWFAGASRVDLRGSGFSHIVAAVPGAPGSLSSNKISGILGDGEDGLWLVTYGGGLNRLDLRDGGVRVYRHQAGQPHSLNDDLVSSLARDRDGRLWVGTRNGGFSRFDPASGRFTPRMLGGDGANFVQAIVPDRAGILWIATRGGLYRYDPRTDALRSYRHDSADPHSLSDNFVWNVLEDRAGRLWVGTSNGLDLLDRASGRFQHARHDPRDPESLNQNRVSYLLEARDGTLWVGTGAGLNRMRIDAAGKPRFRAYGVREGLGNPAVNALLEDGAGHLWISTGGGISDFDPRSGRFRNYTGRDGMAEGDYFVGSAWQAPDGRMFFGSFNNGLTVFHPGEVRGNGQAPQLAITELLLYNTPVRSSHAPAGVLLDAALPEARAVELSWRHAVFSLEFAALHFADPSRNRYAYRLEGFDSGWVETGADKRFATYTNLDPGRYTFRLKASNKDGVWNEEGVALSITIAPPFWKTWWFRLAATLLALMLVAALYRLRVRALVAQKARLEHQVAQRTAEVVQQKEQLAGTLDELKHTQNQLVLNEKMASLGTLSAGVAHEINNPTNFAHAGAQVLETELEAFRAWLLALAGPEADEELVRDLNGQVDALRERAATIQEGTSRIRDLVADLRVFSRPDAAQSRVTPVGANLRSTVQLVRTLYAQVAVIECRLDADPPVACWPAQLNQVFMNLIVNACQAIAQRQAQEGGARPGRLVIASRADDRYLYLDFEDSGCGIPEAAIGRIFDPFFTTKPHGEGTGLGLSISFGIVERHGGSLRVRSRVGEGSCFTVRLPLAGKGPA